MTRSILRWLEVLERVRRSALRRPMQRHGFYAVCAKERGGAHGGVEGDVHVAQRARALEERGLGLDRAGGKERTANGGSRKPTEISALRNASSKSSPRQPTSPVEAISTPSTGSAPSRRVNENCGALTPT